MTVVEQVVTYKGKEMPPTATAKALGMQNGDTVLVNFAKMNVTVKSQKDHSESEECTPQPPVKPSSFKPSKPCNK